MIDPSMFRPVIGKIDSGNPIRLRSGHGAADEADGAVIYLPGQPDMPIPIRTLTGPVRRGSPVVLATDGTDSLVLGQPDDHRVTRPGFTVALDGLTVTSDTVHEVPFAAAPATDLTAVAGQGAKHIDVLDPWGVWGGLHTLNGLPAGYAPFGWHATAGASLGAPGAVGFTTTAGQVWVQLRGLIPEQTYTIAADVTPATNPVRMRVLPLDPAQVTDRTTAITSITTGDPLSQGGQTVAEVVAATGSLTRLALTFVATAGPCVIAFDCPNGTATATLGSINCTLGTSAATFAGADYNRLTVPADGMWTVGCTAWWAANATGDRFIGVERTDTSTRLAQAQAPAGAAGVFLSAVSGPIWLNQHTVLRAVMRQTSGGNLDLDRASMFLSYAG